MYELKKTGKVLTSKFVGTGPSSYEKRIYRAAVSQSLRNTDLQDVFHSKHPSHSWKANSSSARQTNTDFYGTKCTIPVFTQARHLSQS